MPPTVYLVRHAQGENNIDNSHWKHDAVLTEKGKLQALELRSKFPDHEKMSAVMSSPLRRAIQTAGLAFAPSIARHNVKFIVNPLGQEANAFRCDVGHDPKELQALLVDLLPYSDLGFAVTKIDLSLVEDGWNTKTGAWGPDKGSVQKRAAALRSWLYQRPEKRILFVTHGAFLHYLTEDWTGDDPVKGTGYQNCEVRIFNFTQESSENDAHLEELEENRKMRIDNLETV